MRAETACHYRILRRETPVPARLALAWLRQREQREHRLAALGFAWQSRPDGWSTATWTQAGFDLSACLEPDPDGWFVHGMATLGRFASHWEPGAVRHHRGERNGFPWFLPVAPDDRHTAYRRACDYGEGWSYLALVVRAGQCGVRLGEASLGGIESDAGEDVLSDTALELAEDAIARAKITLRGLCGGAGCDDTRV